MRRPNETHARETSHISHNIYRAPAHPYLYQRQRVSKQSRRRQSSYLSSKVQGSVHAEPCLVRLGERVNQMPERRRACHTRQTGSTRAHPAKTANKKKGHVEPEDLTPFTRHVDVGRPSLQQTSLYTVFSIVQPPTFSTARISKLKGTPSSFNHKNENKRQHDLLPHNI